MTCSAGRCSLSAKVPCNPALPRQARDRLCESVPRNALAERFAGHSSHGLKHRDGCGNGHRSRLSMKSGRAFIPLPGEMEGKLFYPIELSTGIRDLATASLANLVEGIDRRLPVDD